MTRLYGRALRGRRLFAKAPFGHWKTTTFVAALRKDGLGAPMVLDGPMTGQAFLAYVEQSSQDQSQGEIDKNWLSLEFSYNSKCYKKLQMNFLIFANHIFNSLVGGFYQGEALWRVPARVPQT
jgi:hypothetical protein